MHTPNPFAESIVTEPRRIETSIKGLNDEALNRVLSAYKLLQDQPAMQRHADRAVLITSTQPGFGKSHLIGRIFQQLEGEATLIYIPPFEDPDTCWKSLLERVVEELSLPQRDQSDETTQMEYLANGVLSHLVADRLKHQFSEFDMEVEVTKGRIDAFFKQPKYVEQLATYLHRHGYRPHARAVSWLYLLYGYLDSVEKEDYMRKLACLDWLHGDRIDEEDAKALGIMSRDNPRSDASSREINELSKKRLLDILMLGSFYRPFVLCFDQTETYGKYADLSRSLAIVIQTLVDYGQNSLTLLTANFDPWINMITPNWEDAHKDRIAKPFIELEGLSHSQALELIHNRLQNADVDAGRIEAFINQKAFVEKAFAETPMIGIRKFLERCQHQWQTFNEQPPLPRPEVEATYQQYYDKLLHQARPLQFDRDVLNWFVTDLPFQVADFDVSKVRNTNQDPMTRWQRGEREVQFGFESGSHWRRWKSIAEQCGSYLDEHPGHAIVYLRTPEQPIVPGAKWKVTPEINAVCRRGLVIHCLTREELIALNAARHLYQDALQGDVHFSEAEVLQYLKTRFDALWESFIGARPTCTDLLFLVEQKRMVSLEEVNAELGTAFSTDEIKTRCVDARMRVHISEEATILQWLPDASA